MGQMMSLALKLALVTRGVVVSRTVVIIVVVAFTVVV